MYELTEHISVTNANEINKGMNNLCKVGSFEILAYFTFPYARTCVLGHCYPTSKKQQGLVE